MPTPADLPKTTDLKTVDVVPPTSGTVTKGSPEESDTPLYDELQADVKEADPADVTTFEEDDDPLSNVGDLIEDDEEEA